MLQKHIITGAFTNILPIIITIIILDYFQDHWDDIHGNKIKPPSTKTRIKRNTIIFLVGFLSYIAFKYIPFSNPVEPEYDPELRHPARLL